MDIATLAVVAPGSQDDGAGKSCKRSDTSHRVYSIKRTQSLHDVNVRAEIWTRIRKSATAYRASNMRAHQQIGTTAQLPIDGEALLVNSTA
jgi:hypothetical protein